MATNDTPPLVQAMVLCDQIYRDRGSGKCTLLGTFNLLLVQKFPVAVAPAFVYLNLADVLAEGQVRLRIVDLEDGSILAEGAPIPFRKPERLQNVEVAALVPQWEAPHAGAYEVEVLWGPLDVRLAGWRLTAVLMEKPSP